MLLFLPACFLFYYGQECLRRTFSMLRTIFSDVFSFCVGTKDKNMAILEDSENMLNIIRNSNKVKFAF